MSLYDSLSQILTPYANAIKTAIKSNSNIRNSIGLLSYWGKNRDVTAYGYSVSRNENSITINGTGTGTTGRWKLTGDFSYASSASGVNAWNKEFYLPAGKYLISFYLESGSTTVTATPFIRGFDVNNTQLFQLNCEETLEFEYTGGYILIAQTNGSATYTNAVYKVDIYDISKAKRFKDALDISGRDYPEYYDTPLKNYINSVNAEFANLGKNGFAFLFVTDQHIEENTNYSVKLIEKIYKNTPLEYVVNGGDIFDRDTTKAGAISKISNYINQFKFLRIPLFSTLGNHDLNENSNSSHPEAYLVMDDYYGLALSQMKDVVYYDSEHGKYHYYYYDKPSNTYLICLHTGGGSGSTYTSFLSADANILRDLLPTLNGNIIIFTHMFTTLGEGYPHNNSWSRLVNAINDSNSQDKVKLMICGHTHTDMYYDEDDFLNVITTTDSHKYLDEYLGTIGEVAFDTVFVNYSENTVKCLRFGRGESRTFTIPEHSEEGE